MVALNLKQNDTRPFVEAQLKYQNGQYFDLSDVKSVRFLMGLATDNKLRVNSEAIIVNTAGRIRYVWKSGDTSEAGNFNAEFQLIFNDGSVLTVPAESYIEVKITARLV